jgi:hypothetical protein
MGKRFNGNNDFKFRSFIHQVTQGQRVNILKSLNFYQSE